MTALRLVPRPRYLLTLLGVYGAFASVCGVIALLVIALIAHPAPTASFLFGVFTGLATARYTARSLRSLPRRWTRITRSFVDQQSI